MAIGSSKSGHQDALWVDTGTLPQGPGHAFYDQENGVLAHHCFDDFAEQRCAKFYAETMGRPGIAPGVYFRMLFAGFFEGIDSERGIAWRFEDSLTLRRFHRAADTGEDYETFLTGLAEASGIATPSREELAKFDRKRKGKASNQDWEHPHDPDARIARMKDGRTHMAHKAEHAVDMDTGAVVAVTLQGADQGDTATIGKTLEEAEENLEEAAGEPDAKRRMHPQPAREIVADKGYHANTPLGRLEAEGKRSYISERDRGRRKWKGDGYKSNSAKPDAAARRDRGTQLRPCIRHRGHEADAPSRTREHPQAASDTRRRVQPEPDLPPDLRSGQAQGVEEANAGLPAGPAGRIWRPAGGT